MQSFESLPCRPVRTRGLRHRFAEADYAAEQERRAGLRHPDSGGGANVAHLVAGAHTHSKQVRDMEQRYRVVRLDFTPEIEVFNMLDVIVKVERAPPNSIEVPCTMLGVHSTTVLRNLFWELSQTNRYL